MRKLQTPLLLLLLAALAAAMGPQPASVKLDAVREQVIREQVTGVASVEPFLRSTLSAEIAGLVTVYPLREGDRVVKDETVVCELKRTSLLIDKAEAEALLARAEAESATAVETARATVRELQALRDQAEKERERAERLFREQVVTKAEWDRAEAEARAAESRYQRARESFALAEEGADPASKAREAEVRRAKARLDRIEDDLRKTRILSPITGRVVRRFTEVGGWVNPGSPVIEVVTLDPVLVRVGVSERDIPRLRVGDPALVRVDAHPGRVFAGKVRFLTPEAPVATRTFPVLVEVPNPDEALLAGMFARVSIDCGEGKKALFVPKDAVVQTETGPVVYTLGKPVPVEMGKRKVKLPSARLIPVTTGIAIDDRVEVTGEGLKPGMPVVTTGNEELFPGRPLIPPRPPAGDGERPPEKKKDGDRR